MLVSANEIGQTAVKACVAAGLPHDRAADLAAAAVWLTGQGADGVALLLAMLDAGGLAPPVECRISGDDLHCRRARPAMEGIAAVDWLVAAGGRGAVHADAFEHPSMMLGLLGQAAAARGLAFALAGDGGEWAVGAAADAGAAGALGSAVTVTLAGAVPRAAPGRAGHREVDAGAWKGLAALAFETYVPSSAASRARGAGAGLVDND